MCPLKMNDQIFNVNFVGEVEKHEALYNYKLPQYSRKDITEKAWQEVADKVNLSASECKEKWRNLRTVFIRKTKPPTCGSGVNRKPYYLAEAMQFCLPFIKTMSPSSSGNFPTVPKEEMTDKISENKTKKNDNFFAENFSNAGQSSQAPPTPPSSNPIEILPQHSTHHPVQSTQTSCTKRNLTMRDNSEVEAYKCVAEYFKAKKTRLETTVDEAGNNSCDRKEALKMFLLSLIPELEELNDFQVKIFKRKVFTLIDEISTPREADTTSSQLPKVKEEETIEEV